MVKIFVVRVNMFGFMHFVYFGVEGGMGQGKCRVEMLFLNVFSVGTERSVTINHAALL